MLRVCMTIGMHDMRSHGSGTPTNVVHLRPVTGGMDLGAFLTSQHTTHAHLSECARVLSCIFPSHHQSSRAKRSSLPSSSVHAISKVSDLPTPYASSHVNNRTTHATSPGAGRRAQTISLASNASVDSADSFVLVDEFNSVAVVSVCVWRSTSQHHAVYCCCWCWCCCWCYCWCYCCCVSRAC